MVRTSYTRRARIALFVLVGVLVVIALNTVYQFVNTLDRLEVAEHERDQWQRPLETIQALNLREGSVVVYLGSGSGYFALRLSSTVGQHGKVLAVDTRRLPLLFLWVRALLRKQHNLDVALVEPNDPHLAPGSADAVLVANTYHELTDPKTILQRVNRALVPGGGWSYSTAVHRRGRRRTASRTSSCVGRKRGSPARF